MKTDLQPRPVDGVYDYEECLNRVVAATRAANKETGIQRYIFLRVLPGTHFPSICVEMGVSGMPTSPRLII